MIKLGYYNNLKIVRLSDLGYMLKDNDSDEEILLHFGQAKEKHNEGDIVKVFVYADKKRRPTATEADVLVTLDTPGFAEIKDVDVNLGVYAHINTPKDILISKDSLPYDKSLWPSIGDKVLMRLKLKDNVFVGKILGEYDIIDLNPKFHYGEREKTTGYITRCMEKGVGIATKDLKYVFVPDFELRGKYHLGQEVEVTITKENGSSYYGMLVPQKEELIDEDKKLLLIYLKNNNKKMHLTAKSSSEDVYNLLKMSRKAFKRALGGLYKDGVIDFEDDYTILK